MLRSPWMTILPAAVTRRIIRLDLGDQVPEVLVNLGIDVLWIE